MINQINWDKANNLIPSVIQNYKTLEVLMVGFMNKEALELTKKTNKVHFWSRTKNRIWMKGEESKNILNVKEIFLDCDSDSILILVDPVRNTCHKGNNSCFNVETNFLNKIEKTINDRIANPNEKSYISRLVQDGINKVAQKVGEEATEVVISSLKEKDDLLINESADLLFHLMILLNIRKLSFDDVISVMKERNKI